MSHHEPPAGKVLLTGATGFIGGRVLRQLVASGTDVRCATRDLERARSTQPDLAWVHLDLNRRETIAPALEGCTSAVYLVHAMAEGEGYEQRELDAARAFAEEAAASGLTRIVYLGGVAPRGKPSRHLRSRIATGEALRAGKVPVFELRAAMVVGSGSLSFRIVRDLAVRLPAMILPRWLSSRSAPIAIDDVVYAIERALTLPIEDAGLYDLPGPEVLSAKEILVRIARLRGTRPLMLSIPILSPRLSSYWLKLVTAADYHVARELVEGLSHDSCSRRPRVLELAPEHARMSFDEAARRALAEEGEARSLPVLLVEEAATRVSRSSR